VIVLDALAVPRRRGMPWRRLSRAGVHAGREGARLGRRAAAETIRTCAPPTRRAVRAGQRYAVRLVLAVLHASRTHGPPAARAAGRIGRALAAVAGSAAVALSKQAGRLALSALRALRDWQRREAIRRRAAEWFETLPRRH
jgi:hypothetical protein